MQIVHRNNRYNRMRTPISFLSQKLSGQKFVATKWPIYKGILARPNLLWQGISRSCGYGCGE